MTGIYKIESPSGRVYIGQSRNILKRWESHKEKLKQQKQPKLIRSYQKYGVENHLFSIITELPKDISQEILDNYEIFYMDMYKSLNIDLLNVKEGGRGGNHSESSRKKISLSKIGNKNRLGLCHTQETKEKISRSRRGRGESWNKGKQWDTETKIKMSLAKQGYIPWNKDKKGCFSHTEEFKNKTSERLKIYWQKLKEEGIKITKSGEEHYNSKLTWEKVRNIRQLYLSGTSMKELSEIYSVCKSNIRNIINKKIWKE